MLKECNPHAGCWCWDSPSAPTAWVILGTSPAIPCQQWGPLSPVHGAQLRGSQDRLCPMLVPWSGLSHCPKPEQTPPAAELAAAPQLRQPGPVCPVAPCGWHSAASPLRREAANRAGKMKLERRHGTGLRWRGPEPRTSRGVEAKPNPVIAMTDVLCPGLGKASSGTAGSGCGGSEPRTVRRGGGSSLEGALLPGQQAPTRLHHVTAFHCLHGAAGDPLVGWRWRDERLSPNNGLECPWVRPQGGHCVPRGWHTRDGLPCHRAPLPARGHGDRALVWLSPPIWPQPQGSRRGWLALNHG